MAPRKVTYQESKLGQQRFLSSARMGVVFTYALELDNVDTLNVPFLQVPGSPTVTGVGDGGKSTAKLKEGSIEVVIGAGIRSLSVEQQINVEQIGSLGFFDIVETLDHNVASNTLSLDKMALRLRLLSNIGVAPWGKDVLTSPRLHAYILDTKERQRGNNFGFIKAYGLHVQTNRFSTNVGSAAMENVTFKVDRFQRVNNVPAAMLDQARKQFPSIFSGVEGLDQVSIDDNR